MFKNAVFTLVLLVGIFIFWISPIFATYRVYWDETGDTIFVPEFPARVDMHMRFDTDDTLNAMANPFTWAGSVGVDSLIKKSCDGQGWFKGSALYILDAQICGFEPPDKYHVSALQYCTVSLVLPGTGYLLTEWSFMVGQENAVLCMDSTFMAPALRLKWVRNREGIGVFPQYTKKCWVIAKIPCGDANFDLVIDIADMVYLIKYFFYNGPSPIGNSDVNSDGTVDIVDIFYLGNYIFYGGAKPNCP